MVCTIEITEKPGLDNPTLVEGLPGIGFVANIATLHMIHELKAIRFAEIRSSTFQDLTVTTETGGTRSPTNELYYYKDEGGQHDLILWHGNTQALTTQGQYELCGKVLDTAQELSCRQVITLGGFKTDEAKPNPQIYAAASDSETLQTALNLGTKIMVGQIFGVAGLTVGLARLRNLKAFSLLVETPGTYPDANAARSVLMTMSKILNLNIDLARLEVATEETRRTLESFGLLKNVAEIKKKEEQQFRWFI